MSERDTEIVALTSMVAKQTEMIEDLQRRVAALEGAQKEAATKAWKAARTRTT